MKNRVWLSSYPKSGNTWLRALLESILYKNGEKVDLNQLMIASTTSIERQDFNKYFGLESSDLTIAETEEYKKEYWRQNSKEETQRKFVKTHEANKSLASDSSLFPHEITELAIHLVRNPLDIVSSLANHLGISNEKSIEQLATFNYFSFEKKSHLKCTSQLYSISLNWSNHIASWINEKSFPVHLVKYEDMVANPFEVISEILDLLGNRVEEGIIHRAIKNTSFHILSGQEKDHGFIEKSPFSNQFFRKGKVGSWKDELSKEQISSVQREHEEMMIKLGYL